MLQHVPDHWDYPILTMDMVLYSAIGLVHMLCKWGGPYNNSLGLDSTVRDITSVPSF